MKELDDIFSSLSHRLGIAEDSAQSVALDTAKLQVQMLMTRLGIPNADRIVKVRRGGGNGGN